MLKAVDVRHPFLSAKSPRWGFPPAIRSGCRAPVRLAIRLSGAEPLARSEDGHRPTASFVGISVFPSVEARCAPGRHRQEGLAAQLRDSLAGKRAGHSYHPKTAGAQRRQHDDDLHARRHGRSNRGAEPAGSAVGEQETRDGSYFDFLEEMASWGIDMRTLTCDNFESV